MHELGFSMSGSGPTYFALKSKPDKDLGDDYLVFENLHAINHGVREMQ